MSQVEDLTSVSSSSSQSVEASVEESTYHALKKVFLLLDDCDRSFFTHYGLSSRQFWALQALNEQQGRPMVDLSRVLLTDKSNVTGIVDRLESAGLATRTPASYDRRVILITLTAEGRQRRDFVKGQHDRQIRELLGAVGGSSLHTLLDLLNHVGHNLEVQLDPDSRPGNGAPADNEPGE